MWSPPAPFEFSDVSSKTGRAKLAHGEGPAGQNLGSKLHAWIMCTVQNYPFRLNKWVAFWSKEVLNNDP